ncbi:hypothetical protein RDWZM_007925 [Blomia tropicalis]|uniref:RING-type E3 ubiquitin transferase n=1 Tax=Blomia tropicalis TaxID=40697 RepID=A0A9Q0LYD4_BLOTA|nr:hypothetical protein RDWZM_007925 [Blomia tropicalis]
MSILSLQSQTSISSTSSSDVQILREPLSKNSLSCPICLESIESASFTNQCRHVFCYECIKEWTSLHDQCPLCRQPIQFVCYNIRSEDDFDRFDIENSQRTLERRLNRPEDPWRTIMSMVTDNRRRYCYPINSAYWSVRSPHDSGVYMIDPYRSWNRLYYLVQYLPRGVHHVIRCYNMCNNNSNSNISPSTILVTPNHLNSVIRRLEYSGFVKHVPHMIKHCSIFERHFKHDNNQ